MKKQTLWLCGILIGLMAGPLYGGEISRADCLKIAAEKIAPDKKIKVTFNDNTTLQGRMLEADTAQAILKLYKLSGNYLTPVALGADSIAGINYRQAWQFKPHHIAFGIGGAFVGALVGQVVEGWIDPGGGGWTYREDGRHIGALAGFLAGIFIPLATPSGVNIHCR